MAEEDAPKPRTSDLLKADRQVRVLVNLLLALSGAAMITALLGTISLVATSLEIELVLMASAAILLIVSGALFNKVQWRLLRAAAGQRMQNRAKSDVQLTIVSIFALFTFVFAATLEIGAFLLLFGLMSVRGTMLDEQTTFILFQMIILLVYMMSIIVRQGNASHYHPKDSTKIVAWSLTGLASLLIVVGVLLAFGIVPAIPRIAQPIWQATHAITLGVGLEALAMRVRLRLPSLWSLFREAVDAARMANEDLAKEMQKRARLTYVGGLVFVALSMAFTAAMATGALQLDNERATLGLIIFYAGLTFIILGIVALRVVQSALLTKKNADEVVDPLERLAKQKAADPKEVFRRSVYMASGSIAFLCFVAAVLIQMEAIPIGLHPKYATDAALLGLLFAAGPYGYFYNQDLKRIEAIDEKFPDLLRDIAESARAGMTLPRALVTASKGTYGALTPEIKTMAAQVEWGVSFGESLERFALRVKTPLIDRTVALVVEAQRAGGDVVDILTAASEDAREIKQIVSERNEQMKMYQVVVFIAFFVFIAVVLILSAQFIPAFKEAVGTAATSGQAQQVGGLKFKDFDPEDFNTLFFHAAIVQAIGGGLVGGVLTRGQPQAGAFPIIIMLIASWVSFRIILGVM